MLLLGALATGCAPQADSSLDGEAPTEPPRNVRVITLASGTLDEFLELSGPVRPLRGADLATEESGVVSAIQNDKGSLVKKGDIVVLLDRDLLDAEKRTAIAERTVAAYNEERTRNLYETNTVSGQEMLLVASALEKAKASEDVARIRYERAAVKAPFDGLVTQRIPDPGELVGVGAVVARVVDPYTLKLVCSASDLEIRYIQTGAPVTVSLDGVAGHVQGTVDWVGFEANTLNGKFPVEVHVANPDLTLRPGVVGRARVLKRTHENVITVPRDAIVEGPLGHRVFVVENDVARARDIELGSDQGLMVIVTDGLSDGEMLIVRGQRDVTDGASVRVREEATSPDGAIGTDPREVRRR
jgi:RND family efflux transporter MFP subunit